MVFSTLYLADGSDVFGLLVFIIFVGVNVVASILSEKKKAKQKKTFAEKSSSNKGEGLGGLADLLKQLSGEEPEEKEQDDDSDDGYDSEYEKERSGHTVIASEVFDVQTESIEDGRSVVSPLTMDVERRRSTEAEFDEHGRRKDGASFLSNKRSASQRREAREKIRNAEAALASSARAAKDAMDAVGDVADVKPQDSDASSKTASPAKRPARTTKKGTTLGKGIKSKIAWSIVLGAPLGENGSSGLVPPGLRD